MRLSRYPGAETHIHQHKTLLKQILNYRQRTATDLTQLQDAVTFLAQWFVEHTVSEDRTLAKHLSHAMRSVEDKLRV